MSVTLQQIKDLDLYKCSEKDLQTAFNIIDRSVKIMIKNAELYSERSREFNRLHVLISRAKYGADAKGYMINNCDKLERSKENVLEG